MLCFGWDIFLLKEVFFLIDEFFNEEGNGEDGDELIRYIKEGIKNENTS
jgi:hypothetical protein